MDKDILLSIIGGFFSGGILLYILQVFTGEKRAEVKKIQTETGGQDATTADQYLEIARKAGEQTEKWQNKMLDMEATIEKLLQSDTEKDKLIEKLTKRVECLEKEKAEWHKERDQLLKTITILQEKTKSGKGLAMK